MKKNINTFVSVGIPTLGRQAVLLDTIKAVLAQDYKDFEIIVADQTTNHKAAFLEQIQAIARGDDRLRYFLVKPANLPAARNFINSRARGQIVIFIDDDVQIKDSFISSHVQEHLAHPEVAIIAGRIIQKGLPLSKQPLYFDKYGLPQGTFNCPSSSPATMLPGGNYSAQLSALRKVGGSMTVYRGNAVREESDLGYRLIKAGYRIFYSSEASLIHLAVPSGGSRIYIPQFDNLRFYINDLFFMLRTVKLRHLPVSMFRRLRIYSGGSGLISIRRLKRSSLFLAGLIGAIWLLMFERSNFIAKEVGRIK